MKYLHIFIAERSDKFSLPFINFIHENFHPTDHFFVKYNFPGNNKRCNHSNVLHLDHYTDYLKLLYLLIKAEKIFFHSFNIQSCLITFFFPILLRKSYWLMWGGDLYYCRERSHSFRSNINEYFRKAFIKNVYCMVTSLSKDYELAKEWYNTRAKHFNCFIYTSNVFSCPEFNKKTSNDNITTILVGHSASPSNFHLEVFKKIDNVRHNNNIKVICPLSYSETLEYKSLVIEKGYKLFGNSFHPLKDFLPIDQYLKFLYSIDIAIFNNKYAQAFSNIVNLLGFGKKVYLKRESILWRHFTEMGVHVYNFNELNLDLLDEHIKSKNILKVKEIFSKDKLITDWNKLLNNV